jgi:hypothetical protein
MSPGSSGCNYYMNLDPTAHIVHVEREDGWENIGPGWQLLDRSKRRYPPESLSRFTEIDEATAKRLLTTGEGWCEEAVARQPFVIVPAVAPWPQRPPPRRAVGLPPGVATRARSVRSLSN